MTEEIISSKYRKNRVLLAVVALSLFLIGLALVMQGLIDTRNFRDEITKIIQLQTKRKVSIKGNVTVSLLPTPTLFIPSVELREDKAEKYPSPNANVEMIRIQVSLLSLLSQKPKITSITFDNPVMEVVRSEDNLIHWGWMNASLLTGTSASAGGAASSMSIFINNGRLIYRDALTEELVNFDSINLNVNNSSRLDVSGSFIAYGHGLSMALTTDSVSSETDNERPFTFNMSSDDKSTLQLEGTLHFESDLPVVNGNISINLTNALNWTQAKRADGSSIFDIITNQSEKRGDQKLVYPVKFEGEWSQRGLAAEVKNLRLEGLNSAGIGSMSIKWEDWRPEIAANMHFSAADYYSWEYLIKTAFASANADILQGLYRSSDEDSLNPIPKDVIFKFDVKADEIYFGNQSWKNAELSAAMADGSITVNQFTIDLPGESSLTLFGVISPSATHDLRFEGSMETSGNSLRNMLTVLDASANELPETGFGSFFAHSNIFISAEQLRLSEADVKLGGLRLNGGMVFYFDDHPRVEADVKLKNINFDYFRDAWRERESKNVDKGKEFFLKYDKNMNFNWLKRLGATIDFRVKVDRFTFFEHTGTTASFRIYARQGDFGIYDINFIYPTDVMRGTFRLNVMGEKPLINLSFSASEINTDYFNYENAFIAEEELRKKREEEERMIEEAAKRMEEEERERAERAAAAAAMAEVDGMGVATASASVATGAAQGSYIALDPESPITMPVQAEPEAAGALKAIGAVTEAASGTTSALNFPDLTATPPAIATTSGTKEPKLVIDPQSDQLQGIAAPNNDPPAEPPRQAMGIDDLLGMPRQRIESVIGGERLGELIDMSWMSGFAGVFDLNISKLVHKNVTLGNFRLQANFSNELMNFKTLTFNYWGGQFSIAGSMYGGKVPGFSVSVAFLNGDLSEIMRAVIGRDNITGGVGLSATIATSGVNFLSWIQQAEGKLALSLRGMSVRGFNLAGVVDAVNKSRTSSDVANSVNMIINNGTTNFSLDGNINIRNGLMRTPGVNLRSESINGVLTGEVRLLKWTMDLTCMFQFPEMSADTIPTLTVQVAGPLEKGELRVDTSSLEAYVAKRIISK